MKNSGEKAKKRLINHILLSNSEVLISFKPYIVMPFLLEDGPPVRSLVSEVMLC